MRTRKQSVLLRKEILGAFFCQHTFFVQWCTECIRINRSCAGGVMPSRFLRFFRKFLGILTRLLRDGVFAFSPGFLFLVKSSASLLQLISEIYGVRVPSLFLHMASRPGGIKFTRTTNFPRCDRMFRDLSVLIFFSPFFATKRAGTHEYL